MIIRGQAGRALLQCAGRLAGAWTLLRAEGLFALCVAAVRRYVADRREFYLYLHQHREWPAGAFRPRLEALEEFFVESNEEADVVACRFEDFREVVHAARQALDNGAVAYCIYSGWELAHVGWLATSLDGRRSLDRLGYAVYFENGEAWTGAAYTKPSYRGRGLLTFSCYRRFERLRQGGCAMSRAAVETSNLFSHRATMRFEPEVYATGRLRRLLGLRFWLQDPPDGA